MRGNLSESVALDRVLEDAEAVFFSLTIQEAKKRGEPVHEVFTTFKPDADITQRTSFSSLTLNRALRERGLSTQTLKHGELAAENPVATVIKALPFSQLMNEHGLEASSIVYSGRGGFSVTYEHADQAMRVTHELQIQEAL